MYMKTCRISWNLMGIGTLVCSPLRVYRLGNAYQSTSRHSILFRAARYSVVVASLAFVLLVLDWDDFCGGGGDAFPHSDDAGVLKGKYTLKSNFHQL